jgi:hypothetical protein
MTEFAKIASAIKMWGWGRAGMILAAALLFRHAVTFDQAVILILLNVVLDRLVYGKQPITTIHTRRFLEPGKESAAAETAPANQRPAGWLHESV